MLGIHLKDVHKLKDGDKQGGSAFLYLYMIWETSLPSCTCPGHLFIGHDWFDFCNSCTYNTTWDIASVMRDIFLINDMGDVINPFLLIFIIIGCNLE